MRDLNGPLPDMTDIMSTYISPLDVHHMVPLNYKGGWEEWAPVYSGRREEGVETMGFSQ